MISDMNRSYGSTSYTNALKAAIRYLKSNGMHAVLATGDMVAGQKTGLDYQAMWDSFHRHISTPLIDNDMPFLPSPGNHDAATGSSFRQERNLYKATFQRIPPDVVNSGKPVEEQIQYLPGVAQNFPLNYAVTMGPALFIALDATAPSGLIGGQLQWLREVLQRSSNFTVKIIYGHIPLYPFALKRAHETLSQGTVRSGFYREFEDLLEDHQVDYFLSGHHHVYYPGHRERTVKYVSVPFLGTGSRYLLTKNRTVSSRSPQGFLVMEFNRAGDISLKSLKSPSFTEVSLNSLPAAISIPTQSASDCRSCSSYPSEFFLNRTERSVYRRMAP